MWVTRLTIEPRRLALPISPCTMGIQTATRPPSLVLRMVMAPSLPSGSRPSSAARRQAFQRLSGLHVSREGFCWIAVRATREHRSREICGGRVRANSDPSSSSRALTCGIVSWLLICIHSSSSALSAMQGCSLIPALSLRSARSVVTAHANITARASLPALACFAAPNARRDRHSQMAWLARLPRHPPGNGLAPPFRYALLRRLAHMLRNTRLPPALANIAALSHPTDRSSLSALSRPSARSLLSALSSATGSLYLHRHPLRTRLFRSGFPATVGRCAAPRPRQLRRRGSLRQCGPCLVRA